MTTGRINQVSVERGFHRRERVGDTPGGFSFPPTSPAKLHSVIPRPGPEPGSTVLLVANEFAFRKGNSAVALFLSTPQERSAARHWRAAAFSPTFRLPPQRLSPPRSRVGRPLALHALFPDPRLINTVVILGESLLLYSMPSAGSAASASHGRLSASPAAAKAASYPRLYMCIQGARASYQAYIRCSKSHAARRVHARAAEKALSASRPPRAFPPHFQSSRFASHTQACAQPTASAPLLSRVHRPALASCTRRR